jgi:hypothetical protein
VEGEPVWKRNLLLRVELWVSSSARLQFLWQYTVTYSKVEVYSRKVRSNAEISEDTDEGKSEDTWVHLVASLCAVPPG